MPKHISSYKKHIILSCTILLLIAAAVFIFLYLNATQARRDDYKRLSTEEYNAAFLSMFPIDTYNEEHFSFYLAEDIFKSSYSISNVSTLRSYMKRAFESENTVSTVYLGIRPEKVAADKILALLRTYPAVNYHIVLAYPSIDYWTDLSESKRAQTLTKYRELADALLTEGNVTVYFFSQEWLICNSANYYDTFLTTEDISHTLLVNCNKLANYYLTATNIDDFFTEFSQLLEREYNTPTVYPDLSGYKIVFFGDSVIGNYTDTTSIPGVVSSLTGATVYNCGYGGNPAAHVGELLVTLPEVVDAFLTGDTSLLPTDKPVYSGINAYTQDATPTDRLCFVINYGLNDYYDGVPVSSDDPYDTSSYTGAFRTSIEALQEAYPNAQIILMTPNFTSYFGNGTERKSEGGGILTEYVNALIAIGNEYNVDVIDNYSGLNINAENYAAYIPDGCHPNQRTRFTIGSRIALTVH